MCAHLSELPLLLLLGLFVLQRVLEEQLRVQGGYGGVEQLWGLGQLRRLRLLLLLLLLRWRLLLLRLRLRLLRLLLLRGVRPLDGVVGHLDFVDAQRCSVVPGFLLEIRGSESLTL